MESGAAGETIRPRITTSGVGLLTACFATLRATLFLLSPT